VYVTDNVYWTGGTTHRIRKFTKDGLLVAENWPTEAADRGGPSYTGTVYDWVAGDTNGDESRIWVASPTQGKVYEFDADLNIVTSWGSGLTASGVNGPTDVIYRYGYLYVCQGVSPYITQFELDGTVVATYTDADLSGIHFFDTLDGDTWYFVDAGFDAVRRWVASTGVYTTLFFLTGAATVRATEAGRLFATNFGSIQERGVDGSFVQFWEKTDNAFFSGIAIDPDNPAALYALSYAESQMFIFDIADDPPPLPPGQSYAWYTDVEGFDEAWMFMRRGAGPGPQIRPLRVGQRDDSVWRPRLRNRSTARQDTPRVGRGSYW
jgi:hypothetical protein